MIVLVTDFGLEGPYIGQVMGRLCTMAPSVPVINLFADIPSFNIKAASYLIAAYSKEFPVGTVFLCVVDPGVGSVEQLPIVVEADGKHYVGPGNKLFAAVKSHNKERYTQYRIKWRPPHLSNSFHGRDLFAQVAAWLALGQSENACLVVDDRTEDYAQLDLFEIIYIDKYGNAMTGIRGEPHSPIKPLIAKGVTFSAARTFSDVKPGSSFCYLNSNGLIEIAVNQGSAAEHYELRVGDTVQWSS